MARNVTYYGLIKVPTGNSSGSVTHPMKLPVFISSISSLIKFLGALAAVAVFATAAQAQVIVSNFVITTSSLSFDLSGTLTGTFAGSAVQLRLLPEQSTDIVLSQAMFATLDPGHTLTIGSATFNRADAQDGVNGIVLFFNADMATGDVISGSVLVSFPTDTFQNLSGTTFRMERGYSGGASLIQATGIGAAVPEPSTYSAIVGALALLGTIVVRRRGTSRVG